MIKLGQFIESLGYTGHELSYTLAAVIAAALPILLLLLPMAGISTYIERKLAAKIQQRKGPNWMMHQALGYYVAPEGKRGWIARPLMGVFRLLRFIPPFCFPGFMQFLADGIKLLMKEDLTPQDADRPLFKLAPYIVLVGSFGAVAVVPFSDQLVAADLNLGVFYILAITSVVVVGILMAGWASNNKWSLLGGMRSAAQIVSYEIPVGLALLTAVVASGSMNLQEIIRGQMVDPATNQVGLWFWHWGFFRYGGIMAVLFFTYYLASLAECNRTPFDLPEAESELISGYHTEYSGIRFAFFFMGEYVDMFVVSVIAVCVFFGGYSTGIGFVDAALTQTGTSSSWGLWFLGRFVFLNIFIGKSYMLVLTQMWIRWTWPRFRVDQMMDLCWKKLVPISFACLTGICLWMALDASGG